MRKKRGSEREKMRAKEESEEEKGNTLSSGCYQDLSGNGSEKNANLFLCFFNLQKRFSVSANFLG